MWAGRLVVRVARGPIVGLGEYTGGDRDGRAGEYWGTCRVGMQGPVGEGLNLGLAYAPACTSITDACNVVLHSAQPPTTHVPTYLLACCRVRRVSM